MRCFIGFLLPEDKKEEISKLQERMKKWPMRCKFVERENLHINFSFLGDVEEGEVEGICRIMEDIGKGFKRISAHIGEIKMIPSKNYIRVLALNVESEELDNLRKEIVRKIGGDSKPLHITLCRVKGIENREIIWKLVEEEKKEYGSFEVTHIQLVKSVLRREGPVYSVVHQVALGV